MVTFVGHYLSKSGAWPCKFELSYIVGDIRNFNSLWFWVFSTVNYMYIQASIKCITHHWWIIWLCTYFTGIQLVSH